jgi:hypothetical protein
MLRKFQNLVLKRVNYYTLARKSNQYNKKTKTFNKEFFGTKTPDSQPKQTYQVEEESNEEESEDLSFDEDDEREMIAKMQGKLSKSVEDELQFELKNPVNYHGKLN